MNPHDKRQVVSRYRERLARFGGDIRALASGTPERQQIRFGVLASIGDIQDASLLDLGCGLGDFYAYLKARNINVDYTGYDICPEFIELASSRYPEASFEVRDIQEAGFPRRFDYIVCSQCFNNKLEREDNLRLVADILSRCYEACDKGMAMDMLTSYVDFREDHLYYYSPEEVFHICKTLTKRVALRHDYPLFEFVVFLYRDFAGWRTDGHED